MNISPTMEFKMGHGLRQGNPLSSFLFLITTEGFSLLMKKAIELGEYLGYIFDAIVDKFSCLQYTNDTLLIIGEKNKSNNKIIKEKYMLFESMSRLKVNLQKSLLVEIDVSQGWIGEAAKVLNILCGDSQDERKINWVS